MEFKIGEIKKHRLINTKKILLRFSGYKYSRSKWFHRNSVKLSRAIKLSTQTVEEMGESKHYKLILEISVILVPIDMEEGKSIGFSCDCTSKTEIMQELYKI